MLDNFEFTQEQTAPRRLGPCQLQRVFKNIENQDNLVTRRALHRTASLPHSAAADCSRVPFKLASWEFSAINIFIPFILLPRNI